MNKMTPKTAKIVEEYIKEYRRCNGHNPNITCSKGWIRFDRDGFKYRPSQLKAFTEVLKERPTKA